MKLRLEPDLLRLRLSAAEVADFVRVGRVAHTQHFGPGTTPGQSFTYALEVWAGGLSGEEVGGSAAPMRLLAEAGRLVVQVSAGQAQAWARGEQIDFKAQVDVGRGVVLRIIVEQDLGYQH